jgi:hypothetical protein
VQLAPATIAFRISTGPATRQYPAIPGNTRTKVQFLAAYCRLSVRVLPRNQFSCRIKSPSRPVRKDPLPSFESMPHERRSRWRARTSGDLPIKNRKSKIKNVFMLSVPTSSFSTPSTSRGRLLVLRPKPYHNIFRCQILILPISHRWHRFHRGNGVGAGSRLCATCAARSEWNPVEFGRVLGRMAAKRKDMLWPKIERKNT